MTRRHTRTAFVLVCVLGCGASQDAQLAADSASALFRFRAVGQKPGWLLEMDSTGIRFSYDYAQRTTSAPVTQPVDSAGARVWHATATEGDLVIVITPLSCEDIMSGQPYPSTVIVTLNHQTYRGCGGPPGTTPPAPPL